MDIKSAENVISGKHCNNFNINCFSEIPNEFGNNWKRNKTFPTSNQSKSRNIYLCRNKSFPLIDEINSNIFKQTTFWTSTLTRKMIFSFNFRWKFEKTRKLGNLIFKISIDFCGIWKLHFHCFSIRGCIIAWNFWF